MIGAAGLSLIKSFEGCRLEAYLDTLANPPVWTVGWGQTGPHITKGTVWTQSRADDEFARTVRGVAAAVLARCAVTPNANQIAAMTSLAYNIGMSNFSRSSVLRLHNAGEFAASAAAFGMWNKAGGRVRAGLTRRRAAEAALYLTPMAEEAQTTRGVPEVKDPAIGSSLPAIAAGAGAVMTGAQQVVAQASTVWDGLSAMGISPHILLAVLGTLAIGSLAWFVVDAYRRNQEGDR